MKFANTNKQSSITGLYKNKKSKKKTKNEKQDVMPHVNNKHDCNHILYTVNSRVIENVSKSKQKTWRQKI